MITVEAALSSLGGLLLAVLCLAMFVVVVLPFAIIVCVGEFIFNVVLPLAVLVFGGILVLALALCILILVLFVVPIYLPYRLCCYLRNVCFPRDLEDATTPPLEGLE